MKTEYEIRLLEVDVTTFIQQIEKLGATKEADFFQKRYVYDLNPKEASKWIRLRTDGKTTTLTLKSIENNSIDGTKEVEIVVSDFEQTNNLLEQIGFKSKGYQENKRTRYYLDGVEIDIDSWPKIPTYVEFEGSNEKEIYELLDKLTIEKEKLTTLDVESIYLKYGFNLNEIYNLRFEEDKNERV